ncbi:MAG: hypothetical protein KC550_00470 [Nanoarchaeota archaeon]|nr:hypothetical protein [Nanoarchaeota archaeon]
MVEKFKKFTIKDSTFDIEKVDFKTLKNARSPIIFDTNFLFMTFEFKIDLISQIQRLLSSNNNFYIYEGTISELESVERKGDKNKKFLPLIVKMLHLYNFKIIKSNQRYVDDQILENLDKKIIIATNDKVLKQTIQKKGFKIMYSRQKSYLEIN